jgi:hypothetical protein
MSLVGSHARAKPRPRPHARTRGPAAALTFARALALKIAEISPGPHRVGLIDMSIRRVFERAEPAADESNADAEIAAGPATPYTRARDEVVTTKETA